MIRRGTMIAVLLAVVGGGVVLRATTPVNANAPRPTELTEQFFAQNEPPPMRQPRMGWLRDLNLTEDQTKRIREIRQQYRDRIRADRDAARTAQEALRMAMAGDEPPDRVQERFRRAQAAREKAAATQFESMLAMREVLTSEQRKKVAEQMGKRVEGRRDRRLDRMKGDRS